MSCCGAAVADQHFSPFHCTYTTTWLPIGRGDEGYLEVAIITTVNKTKGTSVFIWYSAAVPGQGVMERVPEGVC